jgi:hypothetical protein
MASGPASGSLTKSGICSPLFLQADASMIPFPIPCCQPVPDPAAAPATAALKPLIARHRLPLLPKSDNGSARTNKHFGEALARHGIPRLLSPPGMPRYNRGCEAAGRPVTWKRSAFLELKNEDGTC